MGLPLKTELKGGGENFSTGWKGSLKGSCPHWLRMVIMTLLKNKTGKTFKSHVLKLPERS